MNYKEEITTKFGVRLSRKQKKQFREYILSLSKDIGYNASVEKSFLGQNIVIGDIEKAKVLVCAHYDTPPAMPKFFMKHLKFWSFIGLPAFISVFSVLSFTVNPAFIYGVWGTCTTLICHFSGFTPFPNKYNFNDKKIVLLDCIGEGDEFNIYHAGKTTKNIAAQLKNYFDTKNIKSKTKRSTMLSMSDHMSFKKLDAACILANYSNKKKNSLQNIHCSKDKNCSMENISLVADTILNLPVLNYSNEPFKINDMQEEKTNNMLYSKLKSFYAENSLQQKSSLQQENSFEQEIH